MIVPFNVLLPLFQFAQIKVLGLSINFSSSNKKNADRKDLRRVWVGYEI